MKLRCLIVDDEPLAREALFSLLERLHTVEVIAQCQDAVEAFQILQNTHVDLIFLDIEMPEISGLSFLKTLKNPPGIVLTTAYRDYAVEAFELDVIDYLLKPISFDRLLKSIDKVTLNRENRGQVISKGTDTIQDNADFLFVRTNKMQLKIKFDEISYIEGLKDYVQIFTDNDCVVTKLTMKKTEQQLPDHEFIRIHQSYIISIAKMTGFSPTSVFIKKRELPIGRKYKSKVLERFEQLGNPQNLISRSYL